MILIDVRTIDEYEWKRVEGAILHDIREMMQGRFPDYPKDTEIGLYCESGNRSSMAKALMDQAGFTNVKDLGSIDNLLS